jgi:Uri superfamily endonuclease
MKGVYLLLLELPKPLILTIGKLGTIHFEKGWYAYIGSALNGLDQRIQRHLRTNKKTHWHIDYLLPYTEIVNVFYKENNQREECKIAQSLESNFGNIPGFGCSDCTCTSHLLKVSSEDINRIIDSLGMKPYPLYTNP